ncbi:MAG TPA: hypothetical protein VEA79_07675 [Phenylobacterium sp.]|nr:hypothetical protein [Phenylobacterium sp.]
MRTHREIIETNGGSTRVAEDLFVVLPAGRWETAQALANTVAAWKRSDSIPSEYWAAIADLDMATLEELAAAAEAKRFPERAEAREEGAFA